MGADSNRYPDGSRELAEAVGRLLIIGFEGSDFAEIEGLLLKFRPAGLIFFKRNYPGPDDPEAPLKLRTLIERAQALAEMELGRRLFVAIDHEGGRVQRLPAPYTLLPPAGAARTGPLNVEQMAGLAGRGARELAATGFNFNFAPVLDVASPLSSLMGDRCFSDDPAEVAAYALAVLRAYHQAGILGAGKHFPGLGAATVDPHHELPTVPSDLQRLREVDLPPFRALMEEGLLAIMTTHALYPALDRERPATVSEDIVGLIKNESFPGALLTDDLEMGAVVKNYPMGEAAVNAIRAGHDLALVCRQAEYVEECRTALAAAVRQGDLSESRLNDAWGRSDLLRRRLAGLRPDQAVLDGWFEALMAAGQRL